MADYDDIINLPHHVSPVRKPMSLEARAAQFAPFAALSGHDSAINETARLTTARIELSAGEMEQLSERLNLVLEHFREKPLIEFTYFEPDKHKDGGRYRKVTGTVRKIDTCERLIILSDGLRLRFDDISRIDGTLFD